VIDRRSTNVIAPDCNILHMQRHLASYALVLVALL
jgi:hypothetical protein